MPSQLSKTGPNGVSGRSLAGMLVLAVVVAVGLVASDFVELAQRPTPRR
ncbi:MAG: hypothetical protein ACLQBL_04025 [Polyangiaceae bacterium]